MFTAGWTQSLRCFSCSENNWKKKKKNKKKPSPAAFIFNLPTETGLTLQWLHVTSTGKFITGYECSFTFQPNPCNREFEINVFNSKRSVFQVIWIACVVKQTQDLFYTDNVNKNPTDATVCRYLFPAILLYMFRVSQHPSSGVLKTVSAASSTGHSYYFYSYSPPTWSDRDCWRGVAVQVVWPVLEAADTVFSTPDDGCCDTRNM